MYFFYVCMLSLIMLDFQQTFSCLRVLPFQKGRFGRFASSMRQSALFCVFTVFVSDGQVSEPPVTHFYFQSNLTDYVYTEILFHLVIF